MQLRLVLLLTDGYTHRWWYTMSQGLPVLHLLTIRPIIYMPIVHFKKLSFSTCAQTLGQRSPWGLNFERCRLIFLGPQYGTCFTNILVAQNFERATRILGYLCAPLTKCALRNTVRVYLSLLCFIVCTVFFVLFV